MTEYAEGLACNNFDRRANYTSRKITDNVWYVMYKSHLCNGKMTGHIGLSFKRLRIVTLHDAGYMSCSCGYVQRMMMPCSHICSLMQDAKEYIPTMFHIRWHKLFSYYFRNQNINKSCQTTRDAVENLLAITKETCYDNGGKFRGIYVHESGFHDRIVKSTIVKDTVYDQLVQVNSYISTQGPIKIINGISDYSIPDCSVPKISDLSIPDDDVNEQNYTPDFGSYSQQESNLSQIAKGYGNDDIGNKTNEHSFYTKGLSLYQEMMSTCKNKESFDRCMSMMRTQIAHNLAATKEITINENESSTHLYAENLTNQKKMKRKMTVGEKVLRKKK